MANARIQLKRDTTANWTLVHGSFIPLEGEVIIYTDYRSETYETSEGTQTRYIPGMKVGTGNAYLGDLPFTTVTNEEVLFWNSKLNMEDTITNETLVFNRN